MHWPSWLNHIARNNARSSDAGLSKHPMKQLAKIILVLLSVAYPFVVYWGLQQPSGHSLWWLLAVILLLRWLTSQQLAERVFLIALFVVLVTMYGAFSETIVLKLYPVIMSMGLFIFFADSLRPNNTPIIEKMARLKMPDLPASAIRYTRQVTKLWCGFFVFNGCISLATVLWGTEADWLLYNGVISYLLIATLMLVEWLFRQHVRVAS